MKAILFRSSFWSPGRIPSLHGPRIRARSKGQWAHFHRRGGRRSLILGAVFRVEGGKIAEWWVTWDNMTILRALGHLPSG